MTTEEKAKRYDEALAVCKKLYAEAKANEYTSDMEDYETIFPELAESEDEKTRKRIIALVNAHGQGMYKDDMLAWLEKQKTKKNEWFFEKGKWYVKLQHHYEGDLRHFEKGHVYQALSEVKITDGYHNVSLGSWEIPKYFRPANQDEIPEELKQKTKLDENEEIRNYFVNAVNEQPNIHQEWKEKCLAWLEKQSKKKSAWDKDDEQYLLVCRNALAKYQTTDKWDANIIYNWLKNKLQKL